LTGYLYIVATPIGNLGDITRRSANILKQVELIAAEDTRHSRKLLNHIGVDNKIIAYHEHNEEKLTGQLIEKLIDGTSIALISDAGTPLISDPGYKLVSAAHDAHITVIPVPGASAAIAALTVSGLSCSKFIFEGYLSAKAVSRRKYLRKLVLESKTLIFYETPHRILDLINDMNSIFGKSRSVTIARELTKKHEQIVRDTLSNIKFKIENNKIKSKGEFVVILEGSKGNLVKDSEIIRINKILTERVSPKDGVLLTAKITGRKKNEIYKLVHENDKIG
tara:strand:- start:3380 stop:4216 length:837 start_codon:yes stop_codon:yes gene_type:complete